MRTTRQAMYRLTSMKGLGDNIYQRAFIKNISQNALCVLDTPWPEIYEDLGNVYFSFCKTELRTQKKNVKKTDFCGRRDSEIRQRLSKVVNLGQVRYTNTGIVDGLKKCFKVEPLKMDLPTFDLSKRLSELSQKKFAVIRPVTVRKEWHSDARNPHPEYIQIAVNELKKQGIYTISIADADGVNETFVGEKPDCDLNFNEGQLNIREILSLVQNASIVVGGIGWLVPAAIAYETKACFISGGWGEFNHPSRLLPNYETSFIKFIMPDNFCMCKDSNHLCDKTITNFQEQFIKSIGAL
jgi:hypothetical protein